RRASSYLHAIHAEMIPMVTHAGEVENDAGKLAQSMEVFVDSKSTVDAAGAAAAYKEIGSEFRALHASIDFLVQHVSSLGTNEHGQYLAEVERFRQTAKSLDADWTRLRDVGPGHPDFSRVTQFDDDAVRLVRSAAQLQDSAVDVTSSRVDAANTYVVWVSRL